MNSRIKTILILFSLTIFAFIACDKVVYINLKDGERKIVLSGVLCPDSTVVVHISRSRQISVRGPLDSSDLVPDAMTVDDFSLFEDNRLIGQMVPLKNYFYELPGFKPATGKTYRIEASSGEMKPVSASVTVPGMISLTSFDTTRLAPVARQKAMQVTMEFTDPADQENYYALGVSFLEKAYDHQHNSFTDSLVSYGYYPQLNGKADGLMQIDFLDVNRDIYIDGKLFFNDRLINGKTFNLSFDIISGFWMADTILLRIDIQQVDKCYYDYAMSMAKYERTRGDPFVEPVQVYSNVKNGFGLVSAFNGIRKEFYVDWTQFPE